MGVIRRQSIQGTILSYIGIFIGFLNVYIQPHLISNEDIGIVRLLLSFSFLISAIIPLGMTSVILKYFPVLKDPKTAHNGLFALILVVLLFGAGLITGILIVGKDFFVDYYKNSPGFVSYYSESLAAGVVIALNLMLFVFLSSLQKTAMVNFLNDVFVRLGQLILILVYAMDWISRDYFVWGNLLMFGFQFLLIVAYLHYLKAISFKIGWGVLRAIKMRDLVFYSFIMAFTAFASLSIKYIDQLMIGHFLNEEQIAIYSTSILMCVVIDIPYRSLEKIAQPMLAEAWHEKNMEKIAKLYEKSSLYMFFIGSFLCCFLWANIDLIFAFLPPDYLSGKWSFYIVSFASLVNLLTGLNAAILMLSNRYYVISLALLVLIATVVVSNNNLIPAYGITGAAFSTLIGLAVYNLLMFIFNALVFKLQPLNRKTLYVFLTLVTVIAFILIIPEGWGIWAKAILGSLLTALLFIFISFKFSIVEDLNTFLLGLKRFLK